MASALFDTFDADGSGLVRVRVRVTLTLTLTLTLTGEPNPNPNPNGSGSIELRELERQLDGGRLTLALALALTLTLTPTLSLSLSLLVPLSLAVTLTLEGGPNELGRRELARRWHLRRATGAHSGRSCTRARPTARCSTKSTCDEPSPCRSFCEFNNQHEHPRSSRVSSEIVACIW